MVEVINNELGSEVDLLQIKNHKLELENKKLETENQLLKEDLEVKYDEFDWSVIWQDEEKSNFLQLIPIGSIVLEIILIIIVLIK